MHPSSSRAFQRDQERDLKHPGSVDLISTNKTKQNKQPSFIDRCSGLLSRASPDSRAVAPRAVASGCRLEN